MFDIFAKLLSTVATFLFPVFASYKALKTSDPALLTPWLMYWVVLACALLVESWTEFILVWIPFYPWIRAGFLLYLIAPQTQGARIIYQDHVHPFLQEHETAIEDFISSAHDRAKTAGINYLKQAIELLKENVLGFPPPQPSPPPPPTSNLSYTQSLIARWNLPSARPIAPASGGISGAASTASDFYSLLASAVSAATSGAAAQPGQSSTANNPPERDLSNSGTLIPPTIQGNDRISFISAQRERLAILLSALDKEASNLNVQDASQKSSLHGSLHRLSDGNRSGESDLVRPPSAMSGLSKSRSEVDFEQIEREDEDGENSQTSMPSMVRHDTGSASWLPWAWGAKPAAIFTNPSERGDSVMTGTGNGQGKSSGIDI